MIDCVAVANFGDSELIVLDSPFVPTPPFVFVSHIHLQKSDYSTSTSSQPSSKYLLLQRASEAFIDKLPM